MANTPRIDENTKKVVYKATSPSGKSYIGKTIRTLKHRKMMHYATANRYDTPFSRALRKYEKELEWVILGSFSTDAELRKAEIDFIKKYDTYNNGYNCTLGGEGHSGFKQSEETIRKRAEKIKKALTGRKLSKEHKETLSTVQMGNSSKKGAKLSVASKQRIRQAQQHRMRPVICTDTGNKFESISECAKKMNICKGNLQKALKGNNKTCKGFSFKFIKETL